MELKQNARVITASGENVGHVDRVVLDPQTKEVTHVVVHKGLLFTEDKVVPVGLIASATEEMVVLREDAGDLHSLPKYAEKYYLPAEEYGNQHTTPASFTPYGGGSGIVYGPAEPKLITKTRINIPEAEVALKEGARVVSSDDKAMGHVEEVLTYAQSNRTSHLIVAHGLLSKSRKLIPATWIADVSEDEVRLNVGSDAVEGLNEL